MDLTPGPREDQERSDEPEIPREVYREAARSGTLAGSPSWSSDQAALERLLDLWQADPWLRGVVESAYRAGQEDAAKEAPDLDHYSAALDEIFRLRCALVYEARIIEAHLSFVTFPKTRRVIAEQQIQRMRDAARGKARATYADVSTGVFEGLLMAAGALETLGQHPRTPGEDVTP